MRSRLALALAFALVLFGAASAGPPQAPVGQAPVKLSLHYDGNLILKVLDMRLDEEARPGGFSASASLRSYGVLALFNRFDIKASSKGAVEAAGPHPGQFLYENKDGERDRKVRIDWRPNEVIAVSEPKYGNLGFPPATTAQKLAAADPLTHLVRISLAADPDHVCGGSPLFFDGKQLYELTFAPGTPVPLNDGQRRLGLTSLVRCSVGFREVAGFKPPKKHKQGLKSRIDATFGQLGEGGPWVIVRVTASTLIGPAVIELKRVDAGGPARVARE
jgi:hypothetical protein